MDITKTDNGICITGTKSELDMATTWARARLHSVYGEAEGEKRFRKIPALGVLLAWRAQVEVAPEC